MLFMYVFMILCLVVNGFQLIFWDGHTLLLILIKFSRKFMLIMNLNEYFSISLIFFIGFIDCHTISLTRERDRKLQNRPNR
jgi:hypothetical protein